MICEGFRVLYSSESIDGLIYRINMVEDRFEIDGLPRFVNMSLADLAEIFVITEMFESKIDWTDGNQELGYEFRSFNAKGGFKELDEFLSSRHHVVK